MCTLDIRSAELSDSGEYKCVIQDFGKEGSNETTCKVEVEEFCHKFTGKLKGKKVVEDETAVFEIGVEEDDSEVKWFKDGVEIVPDGKRWIQRFPVLVDAPSFPTQSPANQSPPICFPTNNNLCMVSPSINNTLSITPTNDCIITNNWEECHSDALRKGLLFSESLWRHLPQDIAHYPLCASTNISQTPCLSCLLFVQVLFWSFSQPYFGKKEFFCN